MYFHINHPYQILINVCLNLKLFILLAVDSKNLTIYEFEREQPMNKKKRKNNLTYIKKYIKLINNF